MSTSFWNDAPAEIKTLAAQLMDDIARSQMKIESNKAKEDPKANRLSRVFDKGAAGYRYYETKNGRGQSVRYCYSTNKNVAGYFLIWREVESKKQVKRDQFDSTMTKKDAMSECRRRSSRGIDA